MRITRIADPLGRGHDAFEVISGQKTYVVRHEGCADPDGIASLWSCTCPHHRYRRGLCKHQEAVIAATQDHYGDPITLEIGQSVGIPD